MQRNVLVTGGGKRIGAGIVRALAACGWRVAVHFGRSGDQAGALATEVGGVALGADLADADALAGLIDKCREAFGGPLHGLVNSASLFEYDAAPAIDPELLTRHMAVNLTAPVLLAQALAAQDDLDEGAVVNLLDQKVANLNPDFFSYTCSRAALDGATRMLAQALAPRVRVNAVSPGLTLPSADQTEVEFAAVGSENLLRRPIGVEAVGEAVAWLLEARAVTGQNLFVDNGQRFLPRLRDVMFERDRG